MLCTSNLLVVGTNLNNVPCMSILAQGTMWKILVKEGCFTWIVVSCHPPTLAVVVNWYNLQLVHY